jgi:hypothetical protein
MSKEPSNNKDVFTDIIEKNDKLLSHLDLRHIRAAEENSLYLFENTEKGKRGFYRAHFGSIEKYFNCDVISSEYYACKNPEIRLPQVPQAVYTYDPEREFVYSITVAVTQDGIN